MPGTLCCICLAPRVLLLMLSWPMAGGRKIVRHASVQPINHMPPSVTLGVRELMSTTHADVGHPPAAQQRRPLPLLNPRAAHLQMGQPLNCSRCRSQGSQEGRPQDGHALQGARDVVGRGAPCR